MTHTAAGSRRRVPRGWILPLLAVLLLIGAVYMGILSRSIAVDLVAWWPAWAIVGFLAVVTRGRRLGRVRVAGLVPLLTLALLVAFVFGHLEGWAAMPSASNRLVGPEVGPTSTAALSAHIDGELRVVGAASGFLYSVEPVRTGGDIALPVAEEQMQGTNRGIVLDQSPDPGWYRFGGWVVSLDPSPVWGLALGGIIDADLEGLRLSGIQLSGEGDVFLGEATGAVAVTVSGDFTIGVPLQASARVIGDATVPDDWVEVGDGWESPSGGEGWVMTVSPDSNLVIEGR